MKQLNSRQLHLFRLLSYENNYKSANYYSEALKASTKTIYNDIEFLNAEMVLFDLKIEKKPRKGIILRGSKTKKLKFESELIETVNKDNYFQPEYRRIMFMCYLILTDQKITVSFFERTFFVSATSIRKDIDLLNDFLKQFEVKIALNNSLFKLNGSEQSIQEALRLFLLEELSEKIFDPRTDILFIESGVNEFFDDRVRSLAAQAIKYLIKINKRKISDYYIRSLYIILLILIKRLRNKRHITETNAWLSDFSTLEPYLVAYEICEICEKQAGLSFEENDIRYLSGQLFAHGVEPLRNDNALGLEYKDIVDQMITDMGKFLEIDLTDDEKLRDSLLFHIPPMIFRLKRNITIKNPLLNEIKKQYIVLFSLTWYVASDFEQKYNVFLNDDEISFLLIYFQVSLEKRHGIHFKNIAIVCSYGLSTSELVYAKVRQVIPNWDNLYSVTADELPDRELKNIDFVISTVALKPLDIPIVQVSPLMTDEDLNHIIKTYSSLGNVLKESKNKMLLESMNEANHLNVSEFTVFWKQKFRDKKACLDVLIDYYEKQNFVTPEFGPSIFEREKMGDTSVYTGVAIPHALPKTVKKSHISIATLDHPIQWGANHVNIVIIIGISEEDVNNIHEILTKLMTIIESREMIDKILLTKNQGELEELLRKTL